MSEARWDGGYGHVAVEAVEATERRLGVTLPHDYKHFLITTNGGTPRPTDFLVPGRGPAMVGFMYGLRNDRGDGDLEYEQEQATLWDPLPPGFIAVGHDPGGNSLLMTTVGMDAGQVLFWDRNGLWVRDDGQNTFPVAASFSEFVESLRVLETFSLRKVRLFSAACCRCVWSESTNGVFWHCLDDVERLADGDTTKGTAESVEQLICETGGQVATHWESTMLAVLTTEDPLVAAAEVCDYTRMTSGNGVAALLRDIVAQSPQWKPQSSWLTWNNGAIVKAAAAAYQERELPSGHLDNARLAVLADMLEEAGCRDEEVLGHLRGPQAVHVRGCWCVDLLLGKG